MSFRAYGKKQPVKVRLFDLTILLANTLKGAEDSDVGFEDANQTLMDLVGHLNYPVVIEKADLESMLSSCNFLSEKDSFWHPKGLFFDSFAKSLTIGKDFNFTTNLITDKESGL